MRRAALLSIAFALLGILATEGLAAAPGPAPAQEDDTVVQARADATQIGEGDSLTLTVEVRGGAPGHVEEPDLSGLADFTIAAGPSLSTSTSMLWQGGQATTTTSKQFTYILLPRRRGTLTIPSVSVRIGSRIRQTDPISVEVVEGKVRRPGPGARGGAPGIGRRPGAAPEPAGDILVESTTDRTEAYVGEQILLTYKVYTQVELVEVPSPQQLPSYTGFWVEEIPNDPRASVHRVSRGGKDFVEVTLMKKALFATTSGDLTIEETVFALPVRAPSRDPFDSIFFTPTRMVFRATAPLTVRIKPLPEAGRPASFGGAVGQYSLSAQADRSETRVSDALSLQIQVKGTGNIRVVGEPLLPPLPDYKRYEPRVEESKEIAQDRLRGTKTWDYVLTPLAPGRQDIPPIRFAWFDPARRAYVETASQPIPIAVLRAGPAADAGGAAPPGPRREVTAFGRDVRYIKPVSELSPRGAPYHRSLTFATLLVAPILLDAGLLLAVRRREHLMANAGFVRRRRASGVARRRLRQARGLLQERRSREFHQELAGALKGYLGDALDASPSGLTHEAIDRLLAARGIEEPLRGDLRQCLQDCDYARFAPSVPAPAQMRRLLKESGRVLAQIERRLGARRAGRQGA